jgi:hypothetical protein
MSDNAARHWAVTACCVVLGLLLVALVVVAPMVMATQPGLVPDEELPGMQALAIIVGLMGLAGVVAFGVAVWCARPRPRRTAPTTVTL